MKKRILLVDNLKVVRDIFRELLKREGYSVDTAGNGVDALNKLKSGLVCDLVISDINMPRLNGINL